MNKATSEPSKDRISGDDPADSRGDPTCLHRRARMTAADDIMQLPIGKFEETPRFSIGIRLQASGTQKRVVERDRDRGSSCPRGLPNVGIDIFGTREGRKAPRRISVEQLRPPFYPLSSR
jgi:hypothetical protein